MKKVSLVFVFNSMNMNKIIILGIVSYILFLRK